MASKLLIQDDASEKQGKEATEKRQAPAKNNGISVSSDASQKEDLREFLVRELEKVCEKEKRVGLYAGPHEIRVWLDYGANIVAKFVLPTSNRDAHVMFYSQTIRRILRDEASFDLSAFIKENSL